MKLPLAILLTVAGAGLTATATPAEARQGCGRGYERGPRGYCRPILRERVFVVGRHYDGRGYWDGRRWYQHRYRYRNGWRYR